MSTNPGALDTVLCIDCDDVRLIFWDRCVRLDQVDIMLTVEWTRGLLDFQPPGGGGLLSDIDNFANKGTVNLIQVIALFSKRLDSVKQALSLFRIWCRETFDELVGLPWIGRRLERCTWALSDWIPDVVYELAGLVGGHFAGCWRWGNEGLGVPSERNIHMCLSLPNFSLRLLLST